jgi:hypothetical protein
MGYVTFKQFIQWVAEGAKKNAQTNRPSLVTLANLVRQHIHLIYNEVQMTTDKQACFIVQCFPVDCNDCSNTYFGVTLPADMEGVEAAWRNKRPITMFGRWREATPGIGMQDESCRLQIIDMQNLFPTELEPNFHAPCCLMVRADRVEDKGKPFRIKYLNHDGEQVDEEIILDVSYKATRDPVKQIIRPAGIILPEDRKGSITLARSDTRNPISVYSPFESQVPAYKRLKVTGVCEGDQINIKASAKYVPLFFDHDVAEFDNELAIRELAKMQMYRDNDDPTSGYARLAMQAETQAKKYLIGQQSKQAGNATRQLYYGGREVNRTPLRGRRKRW